ncbi:hypothetical protein Tsubulata_047298 [Turnera subulata]|uniref:Cytochrome P450 n=1 Tax=Turnera subulata TaxID=218843 RepID=A0A9Q0J099_9ROSI|nr:hypothetical protein Tsubulata_047298 [Turnera subulata]
MLRTRCSGDEGEADEVRKLVKEMNVLGAKFNLADTFWLFKYWDLHGFRKRVKDARDRYDALVERIIKAHQDERKRRKEIIDLQGTAMMHVLDFLLDISEDENAEMRLTRENIKAFIMVRYCLCILQLRLP